MQRRRTSKNWRCYLSQAANTFWVNRVNASVKPYSTANKTFRMNRLFDGIVLAVILAACGVCIPYYLRSRTEFNAALSKNQAAAEKLHGIRAQVEYLERDVQRLRADAKAFQDLARHKFGLGCADDLPIKLAQNQPAATSTLHSRELHACALHAR